MYSTLYCYGWSCHIRVCVCVEADALRPRAARYDGRARPFSVRHLCSLLSTHMTSYSTCVQSRMMGAMQNHVGEWAICQKARKETCPTEFDGPTTPLRGCSSPTAAIRARRGPSARPLESSWPCSSAPHSIHQVCCGPCPSTSPPRIGCLDPVDETVQVLLQRGPRLLCEGK